MANVALNQTVVTVKNLFFDRYAVMSSVDKASRKRLSRFGAFVRRDAKGSIRRAGKKGASAKPGSPPKSHTGLLRDHIYFIFDKDQNSVVIGPALLTRKQRYSVPTPELLEVGGAVRVDGGFAVYSRFPYMEPAFDKNIEKAAMMFSNSVTN